MSCVLCTEQSSMLVWDIQMSYTSRSRTRRARHDYWRLRMPIGLRLIPENQSARASRTPELTRPNWELITPGGVLLEFGPGWQISSAHEPLSSRRYSALGRLAAGNLLEDLMPRSP